MDDNLWGGGLTAQQVVDMFASNVGVGHTVFDFAGSNDLTVLGIANKNLLVDDIIIV